MNLKSYYYAPAFAAIFVAIGLLLGTAFTKGPQSVQAQVPQPTPMVEQAGGVRSVTVTGSGTVEVVPDMAVVTLGVRSEAKTAREALTQNNTQMQSLVDALTKNNGVDKKDIRTQMVQIQPNYQQPPPTTGQDQGAPQLQSYIALNSVEVTIRDLTKLGQLLDNAVTAGSNDISNIRFDLSNPTQAQDQARQTAMADAARKAGQLANFGNASLGPVININESSLQPVPYLGAGGAADARLASSVPVSPGTQTVQVTVQVTWELNTK